MRREPAGHWLGSGGVGGRERGVPAGRLHRIPLELQGQRPAGTCCLLSVDGHLAEPTGANS